MSEKVIFFADGTCDMPAEFIRENNIQIIGLRYVIKDIDGWYTGMGSDKEVKDFYKFMREGVFGKTSLVTYEDAYTAFEPFFKDGYDIVHIGLSSGLARTWNNAFEAGTDLAKKYGRRFFCPDTLCVSAESYLILKYAVRRYKSGKDFDWLVKNLADYYTKVTAFFTVESLTYLHKGGRLSAAKAVIGGLLNIKPILSVDTEGKLFNFSKATGRLKSLQFLADQTKAMDTNFNEVMIVHADSPADAKILEQKIKEIHPAVSIDIANIGFIIGMHTGPGTIGLGFAKK